MKKSLLLAWLAGLLVGCAKKPVEMKTGGEAPGNTFIIDNSGDAGHYVSADIDINDNLHLVYVDGKNGALKIVQRSPTGLAVDVIDENCAKCLFATIWVSGRGDPQVAYYSGATKTLTFAYRKEGKWNKEAIEWGEGNGMGVQLLVDDQFTLHALYYSGDGWLKHAWRVPNQDRDLKPKKEGAPPPPEGLWASERVDRANGSERVQISFVKLPDNRLAASYLHWSGFQSELRYASQNAEQAWVVEKVTSENNPGKSSAIFLDQQGAPRIVFREARDNRLCLAERRGEGWEIIPLVAEAHNMALAADANGDLLLAYMKLSGEDPRKGKLHLALRRSGVWTDYLVDQTPGSGFYLDAAFTSTSKPVVAYFQESSRSLKLFVGK